ncbi:two-component hybrid sensor and regulator [[Synechococcus] sp. NIES-970]|uniref:GAF domain-containing protein n=1 Tax=Picosynechococcus sp. NKBG15041c TaxID=1407650 RepID=UPI000415E088|nr:GAF domain-containing protein [Picosynechococcus sp. NKBG15041c]BAW97216.1 two-component hybrid sensor and regulator [[Synechococcus] sp. NIES-970]
MNFMIFPPPLLNEEHRLEALYDACLLDTPPEAAFDFITRLAARLCQTKIALISLVDRDRQWFKSSYGLAVEETPRMSSFCAHAIHDRTLFEVCDASQDPRFWDNPLVLGAPNIRFYAGMPLQTKDGHCLGTLCVIDDRPKQLSSRERAHLQSLAKQAEQHIHWRSQYLSKIAAL